jgi:acetyl esterase/lipase
MSSWRVRFFGLATRLLIRRRNWGDPQTLARRARRLLGAPRLYQWMRTFGIRIVDTRGSEVDGEWLSPPGPVTRTILYLHGGGYVSCSPATHRPITAALARLTPARVFALDYRLAPEHPFPAALDDAVRAYRWILAGGVPPQTLALAGDSAGGGLAIATLLRLRHEGAPSPACAVLMSPWTDLAATGPSVQENDNLCDMFRPENMAAFAVCYAPSHAWRESAVSPLYGPVDGLPPLHLQVGAGELLLDDAVRLHDRVKATGGESELVVFDGVFHGWQMLDGVVPEARDALARSARFIHALTKPDAA